MGQLDEAIRAHLELKRKHGASEEELQAEEPEALGPVRRETPAVEIEDDAPPEDLAEGYEPAALESVDLQEEPLEELPPEAFHEPVTPLPDDEVEPPTEVLDEPEPPFEEDLAEPEEDLEDPLEPAAGQTPPRGFDAVREPPLEEGEEDVLEETPDFLQETPEHDRLWFEQKPPRDFDFDDDER